MKKITQLQSNNMRYKRVLLFLISGATAAVFQLLLYTLLSRVVGLQYLVASCISFMCALVLSFLLQKFITFNNKSVQMMPKQFLYYIGLALFNLGVNTGLMYFWIEGIGLHDIVAQATTMVIIAVWSFFMYRILFRENVISETTFSRTPDITLLP